MKPILIFSAAALFLSACSSSEKVLAPAPKAAATTVFDNKLASTINLPLVLKVKDVENKINSQFTGTLYEDNDYENNGRDNLIVKITKTDSFRIRMQQDQVFLDAPVHVYVKGRLKQTLLSAPSLFGGNDLGIEKYQDANFDITIKVKSRLGLTPDWQLKTQTEGNFDWTDRPYLEIAGLKLPIGSFIEKKINDQITSYISSFDKEISKSINLKAQIDPVWKDLQIPKKVNEQYNSWLTISPEAIGLAPLRTQNDQLLLNIGIRSVVEVNNGVQPRPAKPRPLPRLNVNMQPDSSFNLFLHTALAHSLTTEIVRKEFVGKHMEFENGKHTIDIQDISILGGGDRIIVKLVFKGRVAKGLFGQRVNGQVFFSGKPEYDSIQKAIVVRQFDFDLESKNLFARSASWFFKGKILNSIQDKMVFPVGDKIEEARKMAEDALNKGGFSDKISTSGRVYSLKPIAIQVDENALQILLNATGQLQVRVMKL